MIKKNSMPLMEPLGPSPYSWKWTTGCKIETAGSSETMDPLQKSLQQHSPNDCNLTHIYQTSIFTYWYATLKHQQTQVPLITSRQIVTYYRHLLTYYNLTEFHLDTEDVTPAYFLSSQVCLNNITQHFT